MSGRLLTELVELSRSYGRPERDLAVLGEVNTSVRLDDESFLVKASGTSLARTNDGSFVKMDLQRTLVLLKPRKPTDDGLSEALMAARSSDDGGLRPSIGAIVHALALTEGEATFVGHTHPTAVNSVLLQPRRGVERRGDLPGPDSRARTLPLARIVRRRGRRGRAQALAQAPSRGTAPMRGTGAGVHVMADIGVGNRGTQRRRAGRVRLTPGQ